MPPNLLPSTWPSKQSEVQDCHGGTRSKNTHWDWPDLSRIPSHRTVIQLTIKSIILRVFCHCTCHSLIIIFPTWGLKKQKNKKQQLYSMYMYFKGGCLTISSHLLSKEAHRNWNLCRYGGEGAVNVFLCLWEHVVSVSVRVSATIAQHCRNELLLHIHIKRIEPLTADRGSTFKDIITLIGAVNWYNK